MAKLAASEAATAISHQVSIPRAQRGAWARPQVLSRSISCPSPSPSCCVAHPARLYLVWGGLLSPEPLLFTLGHSDPGWHGLRDGDAS